MAHARSNNMYEYVVLIGIRINYYSIHCTTNRYNLRDANSACYGIDLRHHALHSRTPVD